jgi:hypothetical protein
VGQRQRQRTGRRQRAGRSAGRRARRRHRHAVLPCGGGPAAARRGRAAAEGRPQRLGGPAARRPGPGARAARLVGGRRRAGRGARPPLQPLLSGLSCARAGSRVWGRLADAAVSFRGQGGMAVRGRGCGAPGYDAPVVRRLVRAARTPSGSTLWWWTRARARRTTTAAATLRCRCWARRARRRSPRGAPPRRRPPSGSAWRCAARRPAARGPLCAPRLHRCGPDQKYLTLTLRRARQEVEREELALWEQAMAAAEAGAAGARRRYRRMREVQCRLPM